MVYCSKCGEKIADEANFCPKCGTQTPKGKASNVAYPASELEAAFYSVGKELEKAFDTVARETHSAFQKAWENLQQRPAQSGTVVCSKCGKSNPSGSIFCSSCGARIAPIEEPHGSA